MLAAAGKNRKVDTDSKLVRMCDDSYQVSLSTWQSHSRRTAGTSRSLGKGIPECQT